MVAQAVTTEIMTQMSTLPVSHESPVQPTLQVQLSGAEQFPLRQPLWQIAAYVISGEVLKDVK